MGKDFNETASLLRLMVDFGNAVKKPHSLLNTVLNATTDEDRTFLTSVTLPAKSEFVMCLFAVLFTRPLSLALLITLIPSFYLLLQFQRVSRMAVELASAR